MTTAVKGAAPGRHLNAGRRAVRPGVRKDNVTRGLGIFSLGLGAAQLAAPRAIEQLIGVGDNGTRRTVMRIVGVREVAAGLGILGRPKPGGWLAARAAGDLKDLALLSLALRAPDVRRGRVAAALGAVAGITAVDLLAAKRMSRGGAPAPGDDEIRIAQSLTVNRPREEVFAFWRRLENLPRFMAHLELVREIGGNRSHWRAQAPAGRTVEWDAEIVDEQPGTLISWRSLPDADVDNAGSVRFADAPGGRGTEVRVELRYSPPGGAVGAGLAKLLGEEPEAQTYDDLRRFKQVIETGEVVRSEGTPEGVGLVQQLLQRAARPLARADGAVAAGREESA